jgi:hypothetical protein
MTEKYKYMLTLFISLLVVLAIGPVIVENFHDGFKSGSKSGSKNNKSNQNQESEEGKQRKSQSQESEEGKQRKSQRQESEEGKQRKSQRQESEEGKYPSVKSDTDETKTIVGEMTKKFLKKVDIKSAKQEEEIQKQVTKQKKMLQEEQQKQMQQMIQEEQQKQKKQQKEQQKKQSTQQPKQQKKQKQQQPIQQQVEQGVQGRPNVSQRMFDSNSVVTPPVNIEISCNTKCDGGNGGSGDGGIKKDQYSGDQFKRSMDNPPPAIQPFPYNTGFIPAYDTFSDAFYRPYDCPGCHQSIPGQSNVLPPAPTNAMQGPNPLYPHSSTYQQIPIEQYVPPSCPNGNCPVCPIVENNPWSEFKTLEQSVGQPQQNQ